MKGRLFLCLMLLLQCSLMGSAAPVAPSDSLHRNETTGLVLSGGGARGIGEIAVIQVLEDNGIPIDCVTGTSMGAIVGGLYAAGYSPQEMMQLIKSPMFQNASKGSLTPAMKYLFFTPRPTPAMVNINIDSHTGHMERLIPPSFISPMPMNFSFMAIFAGFTARCGGNFDHLFVPLRTVASDMTLKRRHVFSSGQLSTAVRSSMSFPIVFKPVKWEGHLLYDGGLYDTYPFDVMVSDFAPSHMVGVDIHSTDSVRGFPDIMQQLDLLVMRPQSFDIAAAGGLDIRIDLDRFSLLDFGRADEIYDIAYKKTVQMLDTIAAFVPQRRPASEVIARRMAWRKSVTPVVFDSVRVIGASNAQNAYIRHLFTQGAHTDTFGLEHAYDCYYKAVSTGMFKDLDPQAIYNDSTHSFTLQLEADVKPDLSLGIGGFLTSSTNSMLYLGLGYRSLSFRSFDASLSGWLGQSYMAADLATRFMLRSSQINSLGLEAVVARRKFYESDKLFYEGETPAFITNLEGFVRATYSRATGRHGRLDIGLAYGHINDRFYNNNDEFSRYDTERNSSITNLGQLSLRYEWSTLDSEVLPSEGHRTRSLIQGIDGHFHHHEGTPQNASLQNEQNECVRFAQGEFTYEGYFNLAGKMRLGLSTDILYTTRKLLHCYNAELVASSAYRPTPQSWDVFNPRMVAPSFMAAGIEPIYTLSERADLRLGCYGFLPFRAVRQGPNGSARYASHWFDSPAFLGQLSANMRLPFGNFSVYGAYATTPGNAWSVGVSFGYFIQAPRLLRL